MKTQEVCLRLDIEGLGRKGERKQVRSGYARNYLIPRGLADPVTPSLARHLEHIQVQQGRKQARVRESAERLYEQLNGAVVEVPGRVGKGGKLFGSVTPADIAGVLADEGVIVEKAIIEIPSPIREPGRYEVRVRLHQEIVADVTVAVIPEEQFG